MNVQDNLAWDLIYKQHFENSHDLHRIVNLEGKIIACNKAYAEKMGYSMNEIIGCAILEHVPEKNQNDMKQIFKQWISTGSVIDGKVWLKKKDGTSFPVMLNVNNLYDERGKLIGSDTRIRDISEIYYAKEEIKDLKEKRLMIIGELSARIAHDIRNPLTIIRTSLEVLNSIDDSSLQKYTKYFSLMNNAAVRISHQVDDVLNFVKPTRLRLKIHSLSKIISNSVERIQTQKTEISLPNSDLKLICDEEWIEVLLINLILNAIQSMDNQGKIEIRIKDLGSDILLEIEDYGPGIPKELLPKIFDPLFTTRQTGTGLGLPSCKNIVEKHNGHISVKTELGKGTCFEITLPKSQAKYSN